MPVTKKKAKKHWKTALREKQEAEAAGEYDRVGDPPVVIAGEPNGHAAAARPSLGLAIETVRVALEPLSPELRKKVVKAANSLLAK